MLNVSNSPAETSELLTNWLREQGRVQAVAPLTFMVGALCGGIAAAGSLLLGIPLSSVYFPVLLVAVSGSLGCWTFSEARRVPINSSLPVSSGRNDAGELHVSTFRPLVAPIIGCATAAYSLVVPLLLVTKALPTASGYGYANDVGTLQRTPEAFLAAPIAALALLATAEVFMRRTLRSEQTMLSHDLELQRRALRQWFGTRFGILAFMEAGLLPLYTSIYLSDLSRSFAFPYSDVIGGMGMLLVGVGMLLVGVGMLLVGVGMLLVGVGMFVGIAGMFKYL